MGQTPQSDFTRRVWRQGQLSHMGNLVLVISSDSGKFLLRKTSEKGDCFLS